MTDVCPRCGVPLDALVATVDGRCADEEACEVRREMNVQGGYWLSPEGVTRFEAPDD